MRSDPGEARRGCQLRRPRIWGPTLKVSAAGAALAFIVPVLTSLKASLEILACLTNVAATVSLLLARAHGFLVARDRYDVAAGYEIRGLRPSIGERARDRQREYSSYETHLPPPVAAANKAFTADRLCLH